MFPHIVPAQGANTENGLPTCGPRWVKSTIYSQTNLPFEQRTAVSSHNSEKLYIKTEQPQAERNMIRPKAAGGDFSA